MTHKEGYSIWKTNMKSLNILDFASIWLEKETSVISWEALRIQIQFFRFNFCCDSPFYVFVIFFSFAFIHFVSFSFVHSFFNSLLFILFHFLSFNFSFIFILPFYFILIFFIHLNSLSLHSFSCFTYFLVQLIFCKKKKNIQNSSRI